MKKQVHHGRTEGGASEYSRPNRNPPFEALKKRGRVATGCQLGGLWERLEETVDDAGRTDWRDRWQPHGR